MYVGIHSVYVGTFYFSQNCQKMSYLNCANVTIQSRKTLFNNAFKYFAAIKEIFFGVLIYLQEQAIMSLFPSLLLRSKQDLWFADQIRLGKQL